MSWHDPDPRPRRQYLIRSRRCRQRIAQALGGGMAPERVAAVERLHGFEVDTLLADASFLDLVRHYRELAALPQDEQWRRLVTLAGDMLERLLQTGDLRAVAFVLHQSRHGRDPREVLARGLIAQVERAATGVPKGLPSRRTPPDRTWPEPEPASPPRPCDPWGFCAAVQPDDAAAAALAAREAELVEARLAVGAAALRAKLAGEAERLGTVEEKGEGSSDPLSRAAGESLPRTGSGGGEGASWPGDAFSSDAAATSAQLFQNTPSPPSPAGAGEGAGRPEPDFMNRTPPEPSPRPP